MTVGPWPLPCPCGSTPTPPGLPTKTQSWCACVKRLEVLGSKTTEPGGMLGMGEMRNTINKPMVPFPSASSLSLWGRDSNDVVSDGLRGHLGKVARCTKNIFVIGISSLLSML